MNHAVLITNIYPITLIIKEPQMDTVAVSINCSDYHAYLRLGVHEKAFVFITISGQKPYKALICEIFKFIM